MDKKFSVADEVGGDRPPVNISSVERDTGLSKDALRVWERRYGFPQPYRDAHGERIYPSDQVDKLRLLKRLLDQGHRPSKIIDKSIDELNALCSEAESPAHSAEVEALLVLIKSHNSLELRQTLTQTLLREGLRRFVLDLIVPLNRAVGNAWMRGDIAVFEEHLYIEQVQGLLRNAIASIQLRGHSPRVLLTTLPTEQHGMGLLMVEALLTLEGVYCVPLGVETPATDIVAAALAHDVDIVAISFSAAFPARLATGSIRELREILPANIALWVGGDAMLRARTPGEGIDVVRNLEQVIAALGEWRARLSD
ncbi:MAG: MerR family transcriptional regulator [Proteobacteria bacterium]|nr:MerR family transcriptional regulator [Burkholderiales bacterium]